MTSSAQIESHDDRAGKILTNGFLLSSVAFSQARKKVTVHPDRT